MLLPTFDAACFLWRGGWNSHMLSLGGANRRPDGAVEELSLNIIDMEEPRMLDAWDVEKREDTLAAWRSFVTRDAFLLFVGLFFLRFEQGSDSDSSLVLVVVGSTWLDRLLIPWFSFDCSDLQPLFGAGSMLGKMASTSHDFLFLPRICGSALPDADVGEFWLSVGEGERMCSSWLGFKSFRFLLVVLTLAVFEVPVPTCRVWWSSSREAEFAVPLLVLRDAPPFLQFCFIEEAPRFCFRKEEFVPSSPELLLSPPKSLRAARPSSTCIFNTACEGVLLAASGKQVPKLRRVCTLDFLCASSFCEHWSLTCEGFSLIVRSKLLPTLWRVLILFFNTTGVFVRLLFNETHVSLSGLLLVLSLLLLLESVPADSELLEFEGLVCPAGFEMVDSLVDVLDCEQVEVCVLHCELPPSPVTPDTVFLSKSPDNRVLLRPPWDLLFVSFSCVGVWLSEKTTVKCRTYMYLNKQRNYFRTPPQFFFSFLNTRRENT